MALTRSEQMSRIRGTDTTPELVLRRALWAAGLRYRLHHRTPVGRPDVVFPSAKVAVFIDGCFWHGCPLHYVRPGSREQFWADKLTENVERDRRQTLALEADGWRVVRVWEHEVFEELEVCVARVQRALAGDDAQVEDLRVVRVIEIDRATRTETRILAALRDPGTVREETGRRVTAKWRRPTAVG